MFGTEKSKYEMDTATDLTVKQQGKTNKLSDMLFSALDLLQILVY